MNPLAILAFFGGPVIIGFIAAFVVTMRLRRRGNALAALGLPLIFLVLLLLAREIWNPNANCTQECWGTIIYGIWWIGATVGAELGLIAGGITKYVRSREPGR